jgi:hypothetical protein
MIKPAIKLNKKSAGVSIGVNLVLSWTLLPLIIPTGRIYSFPELIEVSLWQGVGTIGWPMALIGGFAGLISQGNGTDLLALLFVLIYPISLLLLIFVFSSKHPKGWVLVLLHILIASSFMNVWYQVFNGYNFMVG